MSTTLAPKLAPGQARGHDTKAARYAKKLPFVFRQLGAWFGMDPALVFSWFKALQAAQWSVARSFYLDLYLFDQTPLGTAHGFIAQTVTPQRVVTVIEALVQEGRLTRVQGNALEACVLKAMTATGQWI